MFTQAMSSPTASSIPRKPFSFTLCLSPLTMPLTTDGPLKTSAEYSCKRDAPDATACQAVSTESIPPTPTIGTTDPAFAGNLPVAVQAMEPASSAAWSRQCWGGWI